MQKKKEAEAHDGLMAHVKDAFSHTWFAKARDSQEAAREKTSVASVEKETLGNRVDDAVGLIRGLLEKWPIPRVREERAMQWRSDEEFGRAVNFETQLPY